MKNQRGHYLDIKPALFSDTGERSVEVRTMDGDLVGQLVLKGFDDLTFHGRHDLAEQIARGLARADITVGRVR